MEDYGIRTQYSFFQCEISNEKAKELIKILLSIVDEKKDREKKNKIIRYLSVI
ncbi:MAG: CRISPR-associated endonuclease Cas2 [bacterium]